MGNSQTCLQSQNVAGFIRVKMTSRVVVLICTYFLERGGGGHHPKFSHVDQTLFPEIYSKAAGEHLHSIRSVFSDNYVL